MTTINTTNIIRDLLRYETDASRPPDGRRVMRDERLCIMACKQLVKTGKRTVADVEARVSTARRVLDLWA